MLCGAAGEECGLCDGCLADLPRPSAACPTCALPLEGAARVCGACLRTPPTCDETLCAFDYAPPVDYLIQRLKFSGDLACGRLLGDLMAAEIAGRIPDLPDAIVPMPLHAGRLAGRGFNQAFELARPIARRLRLAIDAGACFRSRPTLEQSTLDAARRAANVRGAFRVPGPVPRDVAIVDDVVTTGHTVDALARVLRQAGARRIRLWICARARLSRPRG